MPKINGIEVLVRIKQEAALRRIPVVMLTSSKRDEDVVKAYDEGCNSFLQKPVEFERFVEMVKEVGLYWGLLNVGVSGK
jgi:two-component system response regulator